MTKFKYSFCIYQYCDIIMKGYTTVNIQSGLIKRVDAVFKMAGYPTRAGLIQDCLRRAVERMEAKIRNGTIPSNGNGGSSESGEEKQ